MRLKDSFQTRLLKLACSASRNFSNNSPRSNLPGNALSRREGSIAAGGLSSGFSAKAKKTGRTDYHAYGMTLRHLSRVICEGIVSRAAAGKNYGVIVIPEGVLEFINEIQVFIIKLNTIIAEYNKSTD